MKHFILLLTIIISFFYFSSHSFGTQSKKSKNQKIRFLTGTFADSTYMIEGSKYRDLDADIETTDDWVEVKGWKFYLLNNLNTVLDSTKTDSLGDFGFYNLTPNVYRVRQELQLDWKPLGVDLGLPVSTVSLYDSITIQVLLDTSRRYSFANNFVDYKSLDSNRFIDIDNNFLNPANWSNGTIPGPTDSVIIGENLDVVLEDTLSAKVSQPIELGGLNVRGTLTIKTNRKINIGVGDFTIVGTVIIDTLKRPLITVRGDFMISQGGKTSPGTFNPGKSTVLFESERMQHISKANFNNLIVGETNGLIADGNITVSDSMNVEDSLDAQGDTVFISNRNPGALSFDADEFTVQRGTIVRNVSSGNFVFHNNQTRLNFPQGKSGSVPDKIAIKTFPNTNPPNLDYDGIVYHYYDITATGGTGNYNATLQLQYDPEELPVGLEPQNVGLMKSENGVLWFNIGGDPDPDNYTVTLSGVNSFSHWTFGQTGHKAGDTTMFTSFIQDSLAKAAIKLKKKKLKKPLIGFEYSVPNAGNVRDAAFKSQFPKPGMIIGKLITEKALLKKKAYITISKGATLIKFLPQSGTAQQFVFDLLKGKKFVGALKDPKLSAYNDGDGNLLVAELITLKTNIAASDAHITPPYGLPGHPAFGDILFDVTDNPCSGFSLRAIAAMADTILADSVLSRSNATEFDPDVLYEAISLVNAGFSGATSLADPTVFEPLKVNGVKAISQVDILKRPSKFSVHVNPVSLEKPNQFSLEQNYPNPFNPSTVIRYQLLVNSEVTLKVFDILGREIATLIKNETIESGNHEIEFDGSKLSSGIYFYRLNVNNGEFVQTKKLVLIK